MKRPREDEIERFGKYRRPKQHKDKYVHLMQEGIEWQASRL